jgi:hypothetical protein
MSSKWKVLQDVGVIKTDAELQEMIDEVVDAYQALVKIETDEFVLARRALAMHWNALTGYAHHRGLDYRYLDTLRRPTDTSGVAPEGGNG